MNFKRHLRTYITGHNKQKRGECMRIIKRVKSCVECGGHVPPYMNFLCEECWREALRDKLEKEDREHDKKASS